MVKLNLLLTLSIPLLVLASNPTSINNNNNLKFKRQSRPRPRRLPYHLVPRQDNGTLPLSLSLTTTSASPLPTTSPSIIVTTTTEPIVTTTTTPPITTTTQATTIVPTTTTTLATTCKSPRRISLSGVGITLRSLACIPDLCGDGDTATYCTGAQGRTISEALEARTGAGELLKTGKNQECRKNVRVANTRLVTQLAGDTIAVFSIIFYSWCDLY